MRALTEELLWDARSERFGEFAEKVHFGIADGTLTLDAIGALLLHLQIIYAEDEETWERYLPESAAAVCCGHFVLAELERMIRCGKIRHEGDCLFRDGEELDLARLRTDMEKADDGGVGDALMSRLDRLSAPEEETALQLRLLDSFTVRDAAAIVHMICWMEAYRIRTEDDLRKRQTLTVGNYTKAELLEEVARKNHSKFCFYFLERADMREHGLAVTAQEAARNAQTAADFVRACSEEDVWTGNWLENTAAFPHTMYCLLTDESFAVDFRRD